MAGFANLLACVPALCSFTPPPGREPLWTRIFVGGKVYGQIELAGKIRARILARNRDMLAVHGISRNA